MTMGHPAFERALRLRPSNAVARFGARSQLPVLDPRDLLPALPGGALLSVRVPIRDAMGALLRGARELDAPLGLTCPHPLRDRQTALLFTESLAAAARETGHARPLFLEAGPVRVAAALSSEEGGIDSMVAGVHRCVEAGFTLLSFEVGELGLDPALALMKEIAAPIVERDLAFEIDSPEGVALPVWLAALREIGCTPTFLRLSARTVRATLEHGTDYLTEALATYAQQVEGFGVSLSADDPEVPLAGGASVLVAAGVKKVRVGVPFARPVVRALPQALRIELASRAESRGISLEELIVVLGDRLPPFEPAALTRIEALCFGEVVDRLGSLGLRHASRHILDSLAARGPGAGRT